MAEDAERHALRATFSEVAEQFDRARPVAPAEVFDDLVELTGLKPGERVLEIGCGTGKQTRPLAERGFSILAVELGANLAEVARRNLAAYPEVEIVTSSFEGWEPSGELFDAVVAFNSFHWLDQEVRLSKPASVLKPGGSLAVFGSRFFAHGDADPVWLALQEDHDAVLGDVKPFSHLEDRQDRSADFTRDGHFITVTRKAYLWHLTYSVEEYLALLATMSTYRTLPDDVREELFARIERRIRAAGGTVRPTRGDVLYVATTA